MRIALSLVLILTAYGCATSTDSGTVTLNPRIGLWQDSPSSLITFELEQVFGAEDGAAETLLVGIRGVIVDADQNVFMLDGWAPQHERVVSFDRNGEFQWTAGEQGDGHGAKPIVELRQLL